MRSSLFSVVVCLVGFILFVTPLTTQAKATNNETVGNDYPLIFVHGLGGWGEGELFNINY